MDSEAAKITVNSETGDVTMGNKVIQLTEWCESSFQTSDIDSFFGYIEKKKGDDMELFYTSDSIECRPPDPAPTKDFYAELNLELTNPIHKLLSIQGRKVGVDEFEEFLRYMKPYFGAGCLELLSSARDLKIHKLLKVERQKDNKGNFSYTMSREAAGKDEFEPPEKISFLVPVFQHCKADMACVFDFIFDYSQNGEDFMAYYKIESPQFGELLEERKREVLQGIIKDREIGFNAFWGSRQDVTKNDENLHLFNKLHIKTHG